MKINFIGHGLDDKAEKNVGRILCSAFNNPKHYNKFIGLSAFATNSGLSKIISFISDAKTLFKKITWYIGVNDQITTREALQLLLDNEIETYIFFIEDKLFHPKVYIFEGEVRNKIIVGSSNLTRPGLFTRNIEASVEVDFDNSDIIGKKFRKQINDYFKHLFGNSHESMKLLTSEYLNELIEKQIVRDESFWLKNNKYEDKGDAIGKLPKRKIRRLDKIGKDLGNLKQEEIRKKYSNSKAQSLSSITDEYLRTWGFYFEELKKFKEANNGNTIIPRNHPDNRLYSWYRKQKYLYNNFNENNKRLIPKEHEEALNGIKFFWQDGHILREITIWENRLKECIDYCKSKKLNYVWVTWEKKDPKFLFRTQAQWCIRQRRRLRGLEKNTKKKISDYEKRRLKEANFLEDSDSIGGSRDDSYWNTMYAKLVERKEKQLALGNEDWIPSQTDKDPEIAELGQWYNDQMVLFKGQRNRNGESVEMPEDRRQYFVDLGVDENYLENKRKRKFERDAAIYLAMRKLYPKINPKGKARKKYIKTLDWAAGQKNRFNTFPQWRQKRIVELGIVKQ